MSSLITITNMWFCAYRSFKSWASFFFLKRYWNGLTFPWEQINNAALIMQIKNEIECNSNHPRSTNSIPGRTKDLDLGVQNKNKTPQNRITKCTTQSEQARVPHQQEKKPIGTPTDLHSTPVEGGRGRPEEGEGRSCGGRMPWSAWREREACSAGRVGGEEPTIAGEGTSGLCFRLNSVALNWTHTPPSRTRANCRTAFLVQFCAQHDIYRLCV